MANEMEFIEGLFVKAPHENAPDFVKAKVNIKRNDLDALLASRRPRPFTNQVVDALRRVEDLDVGLSPMIPTIAPPHDLPVVRILAVRLHLEHRLVPCEYYWMLEPLWVGVAPEWDVAAEAFG